MAAAKRNTINDDDREEWVSNDEGLHRQQRASGQGMRAFVRAHRDEIDAVIRAVRDAPPPERDWRHWAR